MEQAVLLYRQGKYQECIDAVETTQSRELKYYSRQSVANLYNVAAEAYYELESYESAAMMYQKAIGYSPDILSYYQGEATALIQLGDYSGADEVLAEMAKAVPDAEQSGAYQVVQSELLRKQGDLPDALDAARKAIGSADGNDQLARAYRLAASICEDIGDSMLSEEINLLNQGIEQLPDGYYNALAGQLASAYIRQAEATGNPGYQKDALRTYQQLEKNGNTTLEVRLNIAMLQYQLHDFSKAMEMLQALKKITPRTTGCINGSPLFRANLICRTEHPTRKRWDITKRLLNSIVQSRHLACMTRRWMSWTAWHGTTGSKRGGENDGWTNHGGVWYLSGAGCCFIGRGRERSAAQKEENGSS